MAQLQRCVRNFASAAHFCIALAVRTASDADSSRNSSATGRRRGRERARRRESTQTTDAGDKVEDVEKVHVMIVEYETCGSGSSGCIIIISATLMFSVFFFIPILAGADAAACMHCSRTG